MAISIKTREFLESAKADEIRTELTRMVNDSGYNTRARYSALAKGDVPFVEKHVTYLSVNLGVNPSHYLSNLRLITKI